MFIGLVGPMGAGKSTISDMLGFRKISLTEVLKEAAQKEGLAINRANLISFGNQLRREKGEHVLAELAVGRIGTGNTVVDSIRNPKEVEYLRKKLPRFILIAVDAPSEVRWRRSSQKYESLDEKEFEEMDKRDRDIGIDKCMNMADVFLQNVDLEKTLASVRNVLSRRRIIGLVGMPGSGKSVVQQIFSKNGFDAFNMGDVVTRIEFVKRGYAELNEKVEKEIANSLRAEFGDAAVAVRTCEELSNVKGDICISGLRSVAEADYFSKQYGKNFDLVAIDSSFETRLARLKSRKERPYKNAEELKARDERENGYGLAELMKRCAFGIRNEGQREGLEKSVLECVGRL